MTEIWKGKRLTSLALALALLLTMLPPMALPANSVELPDTTTDTTEPTEFVPNVGAYGALIGAAAELNFESYSFLVISDDPTIALEDGQELVATDAYGIPLVVADVHWVAEDNGLWLKVAAAEGYTLSEKLQQYPWVFQNYTDVYGDAVLEADYPDALILTLPNKGQMDMATGVTVSGADLPENASVSVTVPEIDGEVLPNVFDIKVLVPNAEGELVEWQPIDYNQTVTISVPVNTETKYVDVYHFIDYAPVFESDENIRYYVTEKLNAGLRAQLDEAVAASPYEGYVGAQVSFEKNVSDGVVTIATDSFSVFYYTDQAYTLNAAGNSQTDPLVFSNFSDENGKYYFVTRGTPISVAISSVADWLEQNLGVQIRWIADSQIFGSPVVDGMYATFTVSDNAPIYTPYPIRLQAGWNVWGSFVSLVDITINFIVMPELTLNFESNVTGYNLGIPSESGIFMGNTDDTPADNATANEWIAAGKYPALNYTLPTPEAPPGYYLNADSPWYVKHEPSKIFQVGQEIKLSNTTLEVKTDDGSSQYEVTLVANFVPETHTITWINEGVTSTESYQTGDDVAIRTPDAREGYIFGGWQVTSNDDTQNWTSKYSIVSAGSTLTDMYGDVTLTAVWAEASGIPYQVEHHFQNVAQTGYEKNATVDTLYGTTGDETNAASVQRTVPGFTAETVVEETIAGDGSTVVKIYYKRNTVTITFDTNDGSSVAPITGVYGSLITAPTPPTKQYYTFAGWYSMDNTAANYQFVTMPATDLTLYARWNVKKTTVTFREQENGNIIYVVNGDAGTTFEWPADPTRPGYCFYKWDTEQFNVIQENDVTVIALWDLITYEITYLEQSGSNMINVPEVTPNPLTFTLEDKVGELLPAPVREGYTFGGWYEDAACSGTPYDSATLLQELLNDHSSTKVRKAVYAKWTINQYTITFVDEDGTTVLGTLTQDYGTPVIAPTVAKEGYTLSWDKTVPTTMPAENMTITAQWTANQYTITFVNENGEVLQSSKWEYGKTPSYTGETPTKAATAQYSYTFAGWTPAISAVTGEATYTATYTPTVNEYTITFVDEDGTELQSGKVAYGEVPVYNGTTPAKESTAQYTYTFAGWTPEIVSVIGDATYTATFKPEERSYTITWVNYDGTVLEEDEAVLYDTMPSYDGATPVKAATAQFSYTFNGWTTEISPVTGNATYTAAYTETVNKYTITFLDEDGTTVLQSSQWEYGAMPSYSGTPTKAATAQYTYTFAGWTPAISAVTGDATYFATYTETVNTYTVVWKNWDGKVLETDENVPYGATPSYDGETPVKAADEKYTYTFTGWHPVLSEVTGNATYTALYDYEANEYTITYNLDGGAVVGENPTTYTVESGEITLINPTKEGFNFVGWTGTGLSGATMEVTIPAGSTGDRSYTATWERALTTLTIKVEGCDTQLDADQSFVFKVVSNTTGENVDVDVTVLGNGQVCISGLVIGNSYTLTMQTSWSWRYEIAAIAANVDGDEIVEGPSVTTSLEDAETIVFTVKRSISKWLDANWWSQLVGNGN